jgi:glycine betaine/proline transport system permease protein
MAVAQAAQPIRRSLPAPWWRGKWGAVVLVVLGMLIAFLGWKNQYAWPSALTWNSLSPHLDQFQAWLSNNRNLPHPNIIFRIFNGISSFLDDLVSWLTSFFHKLRWTGTTALGTLVVLRYGGLKAAFGTLLAFISYALLGLWEECVETFALMFAAVGLSLAVGMPLGVLAGRSQKFNKTITPILDAMQIVPAFAYLMPVVILFSVGPGAAVVTTMIYAVPAAIRITALGVRGVAANTVEAAEALGATRWQVLTKVQIPLARRMLLLAVNQTILFALSMVVIAGLIGGAGLGDAVTNGLYTDPARAVLAGAAIVIMAIALDRATEAMANRTDPAFHHVSPEQARIEHFQTIGFAAAVLLATGLGYVFGAGADWSRWTAQDWLRGYVQNALDYVQNPNTFLFQDITNPTGNFLVQHGIQPLRSFFIETPWPAMLIGFVLIAYLLSGLWPAITAATMFFAVGVVGEWPNAMDTFSQVLVATVITVVLGLIIGVLAAEHRTVARITRPMNDVLQTLPQLVYIIPFIYLMPVSGVPGVVAAVLYATPVMIRLVQRGIEGVSPESVEAAASFGATRRQILYKVKIPLARDAIMLGVNQAIIMVLAVVVIGGLVGSGALGYEVAQGLQRNAFGQGVVASIAILCLGIALDRVTQGRGAAGARSER